MGYTHYYEYDARPRTWHQVFPTLAIDAKRICEEIIRLGVPLDVTVNDAEILVGVEGNTYLTLFADAEAYCKFEAAYCREHKMTPWLYQHYWPGKLRQYRRTGWVEEHTKTGRDPYDLAITSVLLRAGTLYPAGIKLHSDGDWDEEWLNGAWSQPEVPGINGLGARRLVAEMFALPELIDARYEAPFFGKKGVRTA